MANRSLTTRVKDTLFGFFGPVGPKKVSPYETVGTIGTVIVGGFVQEKERNRRLTGQEKYKTFSDIVANVTIVAAGISIYLSFIGKAKWKIVAKDPDNAAAVEHAEFIERCINGMETPWSRVVRKLAMYRMYGFVITEWTAKKGKQGEIEILDVESRPCFTIDQWDVDENGNVQGVVQRSPLTSVPNYIPKSKMIYLVEDSLTDDPRGLGILRQIVKTADQLDDYERLEQIGFETDMRGIPVLTAPLETLKKLVKNNEITKEQFDEIKKELRSLIKNHIRSTDSGVLLPSETYTAVGDSGNNVSSVAKYDFKLVSGDHYGHAEIGEAINRKQKEIARALGVEQLLLGESSTGSLALSRDKSKALADVINSVLLEIKQAVDKDLIQPISMLNGIPEEEYVEAQVEKVEQRDIEQISQVLADLASVGVTLFVEDEAVGEVFDLMGLTRPDPEVERNPQRQENFFEAFDPVTGKPKPLGDKTDTDDTEDSQNLNKPKAKPNGRTPATRSSK